MHFILGKYHPLAWKMRLMCSRTKWYPRKSRWVHRTSL